MDRLGIELSAHPLAMGTRCDVADSGKAHRTEHTDPQPTDVELPALHGKAGRARKCMMVIVQFLTAQQNAPRDEVGGRRGHLEASITYSMSQAIYHAAREERLGTEVHGNHYNGRDAKQNEE